MGNCFCFPDFYTQVQGTAIEMVEVPVDFNTTVHDFYDVLEEKYDVGESWCNYLVCTKNKNLDRNQHTRDYWVIMGFTFSWLWYE